MDRTVLRKGRRWLPGILIVVLAAVYAATDTPRLSAATSQAGAVTELGDATGSVSLATETAQFGHQPVVRVYNSGLPQAWPGNAGANNSDVVVSFKALPTSILSGADDALLTSWFKGAPTNHVVWWSYYHEPEDQIAAGTFTAADYRAAWVHLQALAVKANNPELRSTLILMSWTLNPASHRTFSDYYPGSAVINTLGWDGYPGRTVQTLPDQFMGASVALSKGMGKPFGFAEFGSVNAAGRGPWLTSVGQYLRSNGAVFGTYFNATNGGNYVLNDTASIAAWKAQVQGSGGGPTPTATPAPTHTPVGTPLPTATPTPAPASLSLSGLTVTPSPGATANVISVKVSGNAHLSIAIVDSKGATVKTRVADAAVGAGTTSVTYYGYDDANNLLPSGSYTVVAVATDSTQALAIATAHIQL